jgi:hypothetical protein
MAQSDSGISSFNAVKYNSLIAFEAWRSIYFEYTLCSDVPLEYLNAK